MTEPYSKPKYDRIFADLQPVNGKVSGSSAKNEMVKSKLPNSVRLFPNLYSQLLNKVGSVVSILLHAEFGRNDHQEGTPHFTFSVRIDDKII